MESNERSLLGRSACGLNSVSKRLSLPLGESWVVRVNREDDRSPHLALSSRERVLTHSLGKTPAAGHLNLTLYGITITEGSAKSFCSVRCDQPVRRRPPSPQAGLGRPSISPAPTAQRCSGGVFLSASESIQPSSRTPRKPVRREKSAISSGCESRPANRSFGRKQPERWRR